MFTSFYPKGKKVKTSAIQSNLNSFVLKKYIVVVIGETCLWLDKEKLVKYETMAVQGVPDVFSILNCLGSES